MTPQKDEKLLNGFDDYSYEDWLREAEAALDGQKIDKLFSKTYEDIQLKPLYTFKDLADAKIDYDALPGVSPYLRGSVSDGYKTTPWLRAVDIFAASPNEYNRIAQNLTKTGLNSLNLKINNYLVDADSESEDLWSENSDKKSEQILDDFGTFISTVDDIADCFSGIDLTKIRLNISAGGNELMIFALLAVYAENNYKNFNSINGTLRFDPLSDMLRTGDLKNSVDGIIHELDNVFKIGQKYLPKFRTFGLNGYYYREAGANAVQELAFAFASAVWYINQLLDSGHNIDDIARSISFEFSCGNNFFVEIAKFRAARVIWANIMKVYGAKELKNAFHFSARNQLWNKSKLDPHVNTLRSVSETLAAIIGGASSITTTSFDEVATLPDDFSSRFALNIQNVLLHECNLTEVIDPAGGSYFIESFTKKIADEAWSLFTEIEKQGGMFESIKNGFIKSEIEKVALHKSRDLSTRKEILLGTNKHANTSENIIQDNDDFWQEFLEQASAQVLKILEKIESKDDKKELMDYLENFESQAGNSEDIIIHAARLGASYIDLIDAVRISEETVKTEKLVSSRASEPFEKIRFISENYREKKGDYPSVFLAKYGVSKQFKARADFSSEFFSVGGFEIKQSNGGLNHDDLVEEFVKSGSNVFVICSTDDLYVDAVPLLCSKVKSQKPGAMVILAGFPADMVETYKQSGVNEFIHVKANIIDILTRVQSHIKSVNDKEVEND